MPITISSTSIFTAGTHTDTVIDGGIEIIIDSAVSVSSTISDGGGEEVYSGGTTSDTNVVDGGVQVVSSGGTASGTINSGYQQVDSGGAAISSTVDSGGYLLVDGGTTTGTVVNDGGEEDVRSGGTVSFTVLSSSVSDGAREYVYSGGTAISSTVDHGGYQWVEGGTAAGTVVNDGGEEDIGSGGIASFTEVSGNSLAAGREYVHSGGTAISSTVDQGGYLVDAGTTAGTVVNAGGEEDVRSSGGASVTTVNNGGTLSVAGGNTTGTLVNSGGEENVGSGGVTSETLLNGGAENVSNGGSSFSCTVQNDGMETVFADGIANGITLDAAGTAVLSVGAVTSGEIVFAEASARLEIDGTVAPTATISGFAATDTIDLANELFSAGGHVSLLAGNVLQVTEPGASELDIQLAPGQNFAGQTFLLASDGRAGTNVTVVPDPLVSLATAPLASNTATATLGTAVPGYNNDALAVTLTSDADFSSGSSLVLDNGALVYTPGLVTAAKAGTDTISYAVTDTVTGAVTTETQTVTLSDGPAPLVSLAPAPSASNTATATLGTAVPGYNNDALAVTLTSDADFSSGSSLVLDNGALVYTPGLVTAAKAGTDTISYAVTDTVTGAVTTETQTVTLSDGPAPLVSLAPAPSASNTATATLGTAVPGYNNDALAVTLTSDADFSSGSSLVLDNGALVYTPGLVTAAKAGTDTISYAVTDTVTGAVTTETQTVTLSDGPAPLVSLAPAPSASNTATATLGTAVPGYNNDALAVTLTSDADFSSGSSLVLDNGALVYTPGLVTAAKAGTDTISYAVTDTVTGAVTTETQTVTLSDGPAPLVSLAPAPSASNTATATLGTAVPGYNNDALAVTLTSDADFSSGSSLVLDNGALVYTPGLVTAAKAGTDTISYAVTDTVTGAVTTETQTVTLSDGPAPLVSLAPAPSASNTATATLGTAVPGYNNDALAVTLTSDADFSSGSSLVLDNGALVYTPGLVTAAKAGTDTISYAVTDTVTGAVTTETQTVTLSDGPAPLVSLAPAPSASNTATATLGTAVPGYNNDALAVTLTSDADFSSGSSLVLDNGALVYTPGLVTAAKAGTDTISYAVTDTVTGAVTTETQTVTLSDGPAPLVSLAPAPSASNTATATLGTAVPGYNNDALAVTLTSDADFSSGSSLVLDNGALVYTPGLVTAAKAGTDTISYAVTDTVTGAVTTETQTVTLSDGPAPLVSLAPAPSASNTATATLGTAVPGYNNDALAVTLTSDADFSSGSSLVLDNGALVYTPGLVTAAKAGTDTISYAVTDTVTGAVTTETQTVTLSDGPAPLVSLAPAPLASNTATATLGTAVPGYNNDALAVTLTSDADFSSGSSLVLDNGTLVYTPGLVTAAKAGTDTISYAVTDTVTGAVTTETQTVTLSDGPAPLVSLAPAPSASNTATATLGTAVPGYNNDALAVTLTSDADFSSGSSLVLDNGALVYTPGLVTAAKAGTDTISYAVTDTVTGAVTTETQTVTLSDGPAPLVSLAPAPSASNTATATLGTAVPGYNNDALAVTLTSDADFSSGSSLVLDNGALVYTPGLVTAAKAGTDTISYAVTDTVTGAVTTETQTVTLSDGPGPVVSLATAPLASNTATATLGTAVPGYNNDALAVTLTSDADFSSGSSLVLDNGALVYTPGLVTAAKAGTDTISYAVTDTVTGAVTTETQTVTLSDGPAPLVSLAPAPLASNTATATLGTAVPGYNNDALAVTLTSDADFSSGSSLVLDNGTLVYTPGLVTAAKAGTDTISYAVTDTVTGAVTTETQTVTLSDGPAPLVSLAPAPSASNTATATLGTAVPGYNNDALAVTLTSDADFSSGSSLVLDNGALVYTPGLVTAAKAGTDTISYAVTDTVTGAVTTETQTVTLSDGPAPLVSLAPAPSASNTATATLGTAVPGYNNDALAVTLTSDADFSSGSSLVLDNGALVYTPGLVTAAKAGTDTISYAVTDTVTGAVTTETQTVTLSDGPAPLVSLAPAPSASNTATATLGTAVPGYNNDALAVTLTSDADFSSGSSLVLDNGALVYTPGLVTAAKAGTDTISYAVTDTVTGAVTTETQTVTLSDGPAPLVSLAPAPLASNTATATLGTAVPGYNNDALAVTLTSDPDFSSGSSLMLDNGALVYTPGLVTAAKAGTDTISYAVTDTVTGAVTTETQTVTLSDGPGPVVSLATAPLASNTATATLGTAVPGYNNDALAVTLTSDADFSSGSSLVLDNGALVYTPGLVTAAKAGTDTISYAVTDTVTGAVTTETQTVTLSDGPAPLVSLAPAPSASNTATATLGTAVPGYNNDALAVTLTSDADFSSGSSLVLDNGALVYTPGLVTAAKAGTDTISYAVTDTVTGAVTTETQTVTLSDGPAPLVSLAPAPSASNTATATLGTAVPGYNNDALAVTLTSDADFSSGSSLVLDNGALVYTPGLVTAAKAGTDTISYAVTDTVTGAVTTETQTVTLSDGPAPLVSLAPAPSASNTATATLGTAVPGYNNDALAVTLTSDADFSSGSSLVLDNGALVYTPGLVTAAKAGTDTISYAVTDTVTGAVTTETQTVTLSDGPAPLVSLAPAPSASNTATATLGTAVPGYNNDALAVTLTSDADFSSGSSLVLDNGALVYTPGLVTAAKAGTDTISYAVTDTVTGAVTTETQTVTLSDGPAPLVSLAPAPSASNTATATLGTAVPGYNNDALAVTLTSDADFSSGSSLVLDNGALVYTPGLVTAAKAGTDTISYAVTDTVTGAVTTETQTVTLSDGPAPLVSLAPAPSASNTATATLGTAVPGYNNDALAVTLTSDADFSSGSSLVLDNGTLVYTPGLVTAAKAGTDTISYAVTDTVTGAVTTETQTVTLSDGPAPLVSLAPAPSASNTATATLGTAVPGYNNDALAVTLTSDADFSSGSSLVLDNGALVYTPGLVTAAKAGTDTISYAVTDTVTGAVTTETQTVTLSDGPAPLVSLAPAPSASNTATATLGTAVPGYNNDALAVTLTSDADFSSGSSLVLDNGALVYTPGLVTAAKAGTDTISYAVTDTVTGAVTTETQTVTLSDGPAPLVSLAPAPSASNTATATLGTAVPGYNNDALAVTLTSDADFSSGSSLVLDNGALVYTPGLVTAAKAGTDTISYAVTDTVTGAVTTETQTVTLSDGPAPLVSLAPAPLASNTATATLGTAVPGYNNDALAVTLTSDADFSSGSSLMLDNGALVYTPGLVTAAKAGTDTISYAVTDTVTGAVTTETQTVTLSDGPGPVVSLATAPLASNTATATLGTAVPGYNNDALAVTLTSDPDFSSGSSLMLDNGTLVYTPGLVTAANAGTDTINYAVTDTVTGAVTTETQTVTLSTSPTGVVVPVPLTKNISFQNNSGELAIWRMHGTVIASGGALGFNPGPSWFAMATGVFYTGDTADVLWQNQDGTVALWKVLGADVLSANVAGWNPGPSWHIKGTADFNGDGNTDVLWQNDNGTVALWDMNGSSVTRCSVLGWNPGASWHIAGTGNFYGDTNTDVLWQNDNGTVALWDVHAGAVTQCSVLGWNPGPSWHIAGTGDFYGDGNTDVLWQNSDGTVALWDVHDGSVVQGGVAGFNPGSSWHIQGTGDFNGDGKADIAWQNENGQVAVWEMNGTTISAGAGLANPSASWHVLGTPTTMRFIYSAEAGETLAATPTTPDEFVFTSFAEGAHTIAGFNPTQDMIELNGVEFDSFAAVQAATTSTVGGALIHLDNSSSLLLAGVDASSLHATNFALT